MQPHAGLTTMAVIASSGPHRRIVAPFGGTAPLFSPNPFAVGFPTSGYPVLVDICASLTTLSAARERKAAGVPVSAATAEGLAAWARRLGVDAAMPA